jgi:uncharacterized membrane protein
MTEEDRRKLIVLITQVAISSIIVAVGVIFLLFSDHDDSRTKWAIGVIGIILGYWLK